LFRARRNEFSRDRNGVHELVFFEVLTLFLLHIGLGGLAS
jgi:hypothetical protein